MERFYLPLKLKALLPRELYKVTDFMFACQNNGSVTYSKRTAATLHMPAEVIEVAIQTLIDRQVLKDPEKLEGYWKFHINQENLKRYQEATWDDINDAPLLRMSSEVTFTHEQEKPSMSASDIRKQIEELQKQLQEREKVEGDGIPW